MKKPVILIVDDNKSVRDALHELFSQEYEVLQAESGQDAIDVISRSQLIMTVVLDIRMAKMDGFEVTSKIRKQGSDVPIVFHTAFAGEYSEHQIEREQRPFDFIGKNEPPTRLVRSVRNAVAFQVMKTSPEIVVHKARSEFGMIGKSAIMRNVYEAISQVAPSESKVMIVGATGTGKELVARAIHKGSKRSESRFGILNCSQKSSELIDSELFGHIRGAFTGAISDRMGLFEFVDSGTLFLDEVCELDPATQVKLLRVLETGELTRVGSSETYRVNVRVISANHEHLIKSVASGKFREDLYYRLSGVAIEVPSLNDRREDIPEMVQYFLEEYAAHNNESTKVIEKDGVGVLIDHDWAGNVRQLKITIHALVDYSPSYFISADFVRQMLGKREHDTQTSLSLKNQVAEFKKQAIIRALHKCDQNMSAAARLLDMDRSNLRNMILELGIEV